MDPDEVGVSMMDEEEDEVAANNESQECNKFIISELYSQSKFLV